jgi:hypothetical protein
MTRTILAALALACVCSPAMAAAPADLHHAFISGLFVLTLGCAALALFLSVVWRLPVFGLVALACLAIVAIGFGLSPALADVVATTTATAPVVLTTATLPWGDWLVAILQPVSAVLVPIAAGAVTAGIAKYAPWAASVATRDRVEAAIQAGAAFGQNAVAGVAKGKTVTVNLGSAVIAAGAQHVIDEAPSRVIKAAGGVDGIATRIFRALPLEDQASAQNVLQPAIQLLKDRGVGAK